MLEFVKVPSKPMFGVSRCGQVKYLPTDYILKPWVDKDGYLRVQNTLADGKVYIAVHRAVAEVYVQNPNPDKFKIVNHLNGVTSDNRVENLEWTDYKNNRAHAVVSGNVDSKGVNSSQAKLTNSDVLEIVQLINSGMRNTDIANIYGVTRSNISYIRSGKSWSHLTEGLLKGVKRKEQVSQSTINWVSDQLSRGRTDADILSQAKSVDQIKLDRIKSVLGGVIERLDI